MCLLPSAVFFFSSRRRHTRWTGDWSSDVCSSDLVGTVPKANELLTPYGLKMLDVEPAGGFNKFEVTGDDVANDGLTKEIGRASCRERGYISVGAGRFEEERGVEQVR